ncbi:hypothetical protein [Brevibacillus brevis]|nr:hypothetical protein [Brevibacillus brevis]
MTEVKQNNIDKILSRFYGRTQIDIASEHGIDSSIEDYMDYVEYISDKRN